MSNLVFPTNMLGELFTQRKTPNFNTGVHKSITGKTSRLSYQAYPLYSWELAYSLLRDDQPRTNLLPYSQDLTPWLRGSSGTAYTPSLVPNYSIAPDGTLTADRIWFNGGALGGGDQSFLEYNALSYPGGYPAAGTPFTLSAWMKTNDGSTVNISFQMDYIGSVIASVTPNWQRFTFTGLSAYSNGASVPLPHLYLGAGTPTSAYADLSIWGVQMEVGTQATAYIPTNGTALTASDLQTMFGLFEQMMGQQDTFLYQDPDFNTVLFEQFGQGDGARLTWPLTATYQPGGDPRLSAGAALGLAGLPELVQSTNGAPLIYVNRSFAGLSPNELVSLVSRTNLCPWSQDMSNAAWQKTAGGTGTVPTVTANFAAAPDGTTTASRVQMNKGAGGTAGDLSQLYIEPGGVAGGIYTSSVWLRTNNNTVATVFAQLNNGGNALKTALWTVTSQWQRFTITGQLNDNPGLYVLILLRGGTGSSSSADLLMWGAQAEAGAYATRYIPTTTAAVTVPADYSIDALNNVTMASAPGIFTSLLWSGSFYYRCRFDADSADFAEILNQWWELRKFSFEQVKL